MIAEFLSLSTFSQVIILWLAALLFVGAVVVMTFAFDVLVAAVRATSVVALNVKVSLMLSGRPRPSLVLRWWRRMLFEIYRNLDKRVTYTLIDDGDHPVARWRGVFRWEFIKPGDQTSGVAE